MLDKGADVGARADATAEANDGVDIGTGVDVGDGANGGTDEGECMVDDGEMGWTWGQTSFGEIFPTYSPIC